MIRASDERQLLLDWYGGMLAVYRDRLTEADRVELTAWEERNLGVLATSDWPGWERFLPKRPGREMALVGRKKRA